MHILIKIQNGLHMFMLIKLKFKADGNRVDFVLNTKCFEGFIDRCMDWMQSIDIKNVS